LTEEHNMKTYADLSQIYANWARGRLFDPEAGAVGLRRALESYLFEGNKSGSPSFHAMLAELEAMQSDFDSALALIDQGLAIANETGEHYTDSYLYRLRGETLQRYDPANPTPAEEAFEAALTIAKRQRARSLELLASLALAKLYQSSGRLVDAHAVLGPVLETFSMTPEMPEIAEAQTLLGHVRPRKG
jgi:predicted ATPase